MRSRRTQHAESRQQKGTTKASCTPGGAGVAALVPALAAAEARGLSVGVTLAHLVRGRSRQRMRFWRQAAGGSRKLQSRGCCPARRGPPGAKARMEQRAVSGCCPRPGGESGRRADGAGIHRRRRVHRRDGLDADGGRAVVLLRQPRSGDGVHRAGVHLPPSQRHGARAALGSPSPRLSFLPSPQSLLKSSHSTVASNGCVVLALGTGTESARATRRVLRAQRTTRATQQPSLTSLRRESCSVFTWSMDFAPSPAQSCGGKGQLLKSFGICHLRFIKTPFDSNFV